MVRLPLTRGLTGRERGALVEFVGALVEALPDKVDRIILFGSKARGNSGPNSDSDVAVVVRGNKSPALRLRVAEPAFGPISEYGVDISPLLVTARAFRENSPLSRRIKREGVVLWKRRST